MIELVPEAPAGGGQRARDRLRAIGAAQAPGGVRERRARADLTARTALRRDREQRRGGLASIAAQDPHSRTAGAPETRRRLREAQRATRDGIRGRGLAEGDDRDLRLSLAGEAAE